MAALQQLWALRQRRPWFVACSLAVLAFLLAYPAVQWWLQSIEVAGEFRYFDLGAYRRAVRNWQAGDPLYVENEGGGYHGSYLYPPVYVLLFWPLQDLAFEAAGVVWNAISIALLWAGLQAAIAAYGLGLASYERVLLLWALVGFHPTVVSMRLAQVSVFLAGLLSLALAALLYADRNDDTLAHYASGIATALGGTVKLIYAPAGAHLLADRRRFFGAVVTALALLAVSLAVFGIDTHRAYLDVLTWGKGWGESRHPSIWGPALYRPLYVLGPTVGMAVRILGAILVSALAVVSAGDSVDPEVFALGVAAIPLLAPRAYTQDLVVFLPVVVVLLASELRRPDGQPLVPVVGLWLAAVHAHGLFVFVEVLPGEVPGGGYLIDLAPILQPGLWAALCLIGLATWRVAEGATLPAREE
jgi:hypothetical protein